ncbi:AAA family ATPase [Roseospira marina]|uniref:AAA family ATPase n=1 Tax=Roseospira marina TaxID=140057 RepID=A0A5M6IBN9_9PROT|nr:AAA family ATPase [Roseospira marina]KAA5605663.1 AAA family ATPase [Roseospira marina]MBB4313259.1 putative ATPase [Roseospira marina]MBB5086000.1 putative ATPase [Roseospira marina]
MTRFVVISGCSGGGKSTVLAALARRGYAIVEEPGRRIIRAEEQRGGTALPWVDLAAFARRAVAMALDDRAAASQAPGAWVFFDRGLIDAAAALAQATGDDAPLADLSLCHRYHRQVFLTPPWPEIYVTEPERRHDLSAAVAEYDRLLRLYPTLGYEVVLVPKVSVAERAAFILSTLAAPDGPADPVAD